MTIEILLFVYYDGIYCCMMLGSDVPWAEAAIIGACMILLFLIFLFTKILLLSNSSP